MAGIPGNAVVQVDGKAITKDTFNHWMGVAASSGAGATGGKAVVPVPPTYSACIAHLAATSPKPAKGQKAPTTSQLKSECATQYKSLQQEVLGFLISSSWVIGEAKSVGVKLTDKEVHKQFEKIKTQQFPKAGEFEKFLATSGQSVSDLLLRVKLNMLSQKIQQKIVKSQSENHAGADSEVLQRKQVSLRRTRKTQRGDHPHEDRSGCQERQI